MFVTPKPLVPRAHLSPYVLFGKMMVVVAAALWGAQALTASNQEDYRRGEALTLESYSADYENYRHDLMDNTESFAFNATLMVVMLVGVFSIYEVTGYALGRGVAALSARNARALGTSSEEPPAPEHAA